MHHNSTASLQHGWHYSFNDLKKYLSSHEDLFDNIFEKTMEIGTILLVAVLLYMFILIVGSLNHANQAYADGLSYLLYNTLQDLMHKALTGFM